MTSLFDILMTSNVMSAFLEFVISQWHPNDLTFVMSQVDWVQKVRSVWTSAAIEIKWEQRVCRMFTMDSIIQAKVLKELINSLLDHKNLGHLKIEFWHHRLKVCQVYHSWIVWILFDAATFIGCLIHDWCETVPDLQLQHFSENHWAICGPFPKSWFVVS